MLNEMAGWIFQKEQNWNKFQVLQALETRGVIAIDSHNYQARSFWYLEVILLSHLCPNCAVVAPLEHYAGSGQRLSAASISIEHICEYEL
jgi:hypothetical protein